MRGLGPPGGAWRGRPTELSGAQADALLDAWYDYVNGWNQQQKESASAKGMTPAQAKRALEKVVKDKDHAYWKPEALGHREAVEEVSALYRRAYSE